MTACQDPTQVSVIVRTNVPYRSDASMALWTSKGGQIAAGTTPQAVYREPWLPEGTLGDLVVTPSQSQNEPLSVRVVLGVGRDPTTCSDTDTKGCVVARRRLAFVPHTRLRVPVVLHLACLGVVCAQDATCDRAGKCVSASVDPAACASVDGCLLPGDPVTGVPAPPADAGPTLDAAVTDAAVVK